MEQPQAILIALQEQVVCYQRLAKLAELQHDHVQQGRTESLLEVLARRQEVLDQVAEKEALIAPAKRDWHQYVQSLPGDLRPQAETALAETRRLLEQITTSDRDDTMILHQRKLALGRQINQATVSRQVNRNYAASAYGNRSSQMDVKQ